MPPGAAEEGAREDCELRDGASPPTLERCAISALARIGVRRSWPKASHVRGIRVRRTEAGRRAHRSSDGGYQGSDAAAWARSRRSELSRGSVMVVTVPGAGRCGAPCVIPDIRSPPGRVDRDCSSASRGYPGFNPNTEPQTSRIAGNPTYSNKAVAAPIFTQRIGPQSGQPYSYGGCRRPTRAR
jgi:hypothetical protein